MLARTAGGYLAGLALLTAYGGIVCPLMAEFGSLRLGAILGAGFAAALVLEAVDWRVRPGIDPVVRWTLQWSRWLLPGMAVFLAEATMADAPLGIMFASSAKMAIASVTLGFFVSSWICLGLEHQWYLDQKREGRNSPSRPYLSIASRILGFSMRAALGIGIVILILIAKQMGKPVDRMLMLEVGLVLGVMLAALAVITINYRRNFELLYRFQLDVLQSVREGQLETSVPLVSSDEFRSIAEGTNEMIAGLREREKLRATFGKHFSPETAKRILAAGGGLGGEAMEVTVLFTDLRDYTRLVKASRRRRW